MMLGLYLPQVSAASINEKEGVIGKIKKLTNGTNLEMIDARLRCLKEII